MCRFNPFRHTCVNLHIWEKDGIIDTFFFCFMQRYIWDMYFFKVSFSKAEYIHMFYYFLLSPEILLRSANTGVEHIRFKEKGTVEVWILTLHVFLYLGKCILFFSILWLCGKLVLEAQGEVCPFLLSPLCVNWERKLPVVEDILTACIYFLTYLANT